MKTRTRTETQLRAEPRESAELKVLRRNKVKGFKAKSESARPPGPRSKKRHKIDVLCEEVRLPSPAVEPPARDPMIRVYSEDSAYVDTQVQSGPLSFVQITRDTLLYWRQGLCHDNTPQGQ